MRLLTCLCLCLTHFLLSCAHEKTRIRGKRHFVSDSRNRWGESDAELYAEQTALETWRWVIEGVSPVRSHCPECHEGDLLAEQDFILYSLHETFGQVKLISRDAYLLNVQFVEITSHLSIRSVYSRIRDIPGVRNVGTSRDVEIEQEQRPTKPLRGPTTFEVAADYVDAEMARQEYCVSGKGIRVAIVDTGIDYTHSLLGGNGTETAFQAAFGDNASSVENTQRDGLFPTAKVVDGYDFVGDRSTILDIKTDEDPIDYPQGHGTRVASCLLAVAPDAELLAVKVCSKAGCPEHSVLAGISYAVQQGAQVINLSMGTPYRNGFYSVLTRAAEEAHEHGIVVVVSAGNHGNIPFVMGDFASSRNAITVGATDTFFRKGFMTKFSSRGLPDGVRLKPDLSAPGGSMVAAASGSGTGVMTTSGTSFSCPFAAGAAALLLERCPECSPFAIKALLMNNAARNIKYHLGRAIPAPLSWSGNGQLQVVQSLSADVWAYSVDDVQPSFSLGMINAFEDMSIHRTLRLNKLLNDDLTVTIQVQHRDPSMEDALEVDLETTSLRWSSPCGDEIDIGITFSIMARRTPTNHLTSSGRAANDPRNLDVHEFDGWIVIEYRTTSGLPTEKTKEISVPFHSVLRKASDLVPESGTFLSPVGQGSHDINVNLFNNGVGTAQVDVFELLHISQDDAEAQEGSDKPSADFNYIGYRSITGTTPDCEFVLEFAFHLWERHRRLVQTQLQVRIDLDRDSQIDYILANRGQEYHDTDFSDCRILKKGEETWNCAGFSPDHGTNSATTILRACSNDVGIDNTKNQTINVSFASYGFPNERIAADETDFMSIRVPIPTLSAPSYDIPGGSILSTMSLTATQNISVNTDATPLGFLLVTNGWRNKDQTGASTEKSEAIAFTFWKDPAPSEMTADILMYPQAIDLSGPGCTWSHKPNQCAVRRELQSGPLCPFDFSSEQERRSHSRTLEVCNENDIPRPAVDTVMPWGLLFSDTYAPSQTPSNPPSLVPSLSPSQDPTVSPSTHPSELPSPIPTRLPSKAPTVALSNAPFLVPSSQGAESFTVSSSPSLQIVESDERGTPSVTSMSWRNPLNKTIFFAVTIMHLII